MKIEVPKNPFEDEPERGSSTPVDLPGAREVPLVPASRSKRAIDLERIRELRESLKAESVAAPSPSLEFSTETVAQTTEASTAEVAGPDTSEETPTIETQTPSQSKKSVLGRWIARSAGVASAIGLSFFLGQNNIKPEGKTKEEGKTGKAAVVNAVQAPTNTSSAFYTPHTTNRPESFELANPVSATNAVRESVKVVEPEQQPVPAATPTKTSQPKATTFTGPQQVPPVVLVEKPPSTLKKIGHGFLGIFRQGPAPEQMQHYHYSDRPIEELNVRFNLRKGASDTKRNRK